MLSLHPDFRTSSKEPHWLARTRYYQDPPLTLDQYTRAMAASLVQTERKSMGVREVNQSHYEQALEEVLRTRHNRVLGMYRLFALQNRRAVTRDFLQCGILTIVASDKPVQPPYKLRISKYCSVSSLRHIHSVSDYQRL